MTGYAATCAFRDRLEPPLHPRRSMTPHSRALREHGGVAVVSHIGLPRGLTALQGSRLVAERIDDDQTIQRLPVREVFRQKAI